MGIDILIFIAFLIVVFYVGLKKSGKVTNLKEYALGNKNFSTFTVGATIAATFVSGSMLHITISNVYSKGLPYIIVSIAMGIGIFIVGTFLGTRMGKFFDDLSLPQSIGKIYGEKVRLIAAFSSIILSIGMVVVQFKASAYTLNSLLNINSTYCSILAAAIVIIYSAFGGIKSVTYTDIIQFITFSIFIPIICILIYSKIKNPKDIFYTIKTNKIFSFKEIYQNPKTLWYVLSLTVFASIGGIRPSAYQRILISKSKNQIKQAFFIASATYVVVKLVLTVIAIFVLTDNPNLQNSDSVLSFIVTTYLNKTFKGIMATCIMAMIMSTADSCLNSATVILLNDLLPTLGFNIKNKMINIKIISICLGSIALIISFTKNNLFDIVMMANTFYVPIITVPLFLTIIGIRTSTNIIYWSMFVGFITVVIWMFVPFLANSGIQSFIPGLLFNFFTFVTLHKIKNFRNNEGK